MGLLERIGRDAEQAGIAIPGAECVRAEFELAAPRQMIVTPEDFLRRRSKIALLVRRDELPAADGLMTACRMLFGSAAEKRER